MSTIYQHDNQAPPRGPLAKLFKGRNGDDDARREWTLVGVGLIGLLAVLAVVIAVVSFASSQNGEPAVAATADAAPVAAVAPSTGGLTPAPSIDDAKGVEYEPFEWVDPTLPEVPAGDVKEFTVDVAEHNVQVHPDLAPTNAWTYAVNGEVFRGTAASPPIVVEEGDDVAITFVNGGSEEMKVSMAHSIDFHSAEVNPGEYYVNVKPGEEKLIRFKAKHPGVFMYHCATSPILMHVGAGMSGAMIVKPKDLPPVDRELWITQAEYYIGQPGATADMEKLQAIAPDVVAFNGYADQYSAKPIDVKAGERIRLYVLNTGPSKWSAFHVIGTIFDRVVSDNGVAEHVQTMNLAPSQGGFAEFTLDEEGTYPFLTHAFGDMVKGAHGVLKTENAPVAGEAGHPAPADDAKAAGHDHDAHS